MISAIINMVEETQKKDKDPWESSPFKKLLTLTIDGRGRVGEEIVSRAIATTPHKIDENISDVNDGNKYDMKVDGKRIEIKTAYRDKSNSWQHENIYKNAGVDKVVFVDFDYDKVIMSVASSDIIPFSERNTTFGKKATLRKSKDDGYKLDFSRTTHKNLDKAGLVKTFKSNATDKEIGEWLNNMI